jgi:hypothetical protein
LTPGKTGRKILITDLQTTRKTGARKMEKAHSINGVNGRLFVVKNPGVRADGCFDAQKWVSESRPITGYGAGGTLTVEIRYDDQCENKHNSFAITAHVITPRSRRMGDWEACGCLHEDIARVFPELESLIKWHLFDANGPMHYVANTIYHATNWADSRYEPGAPCAWETRARFGNFPITFLFSKCFRTFLETRMQSIARGPVAPVAVPYVKRNDGSNYDFEPHYTVTGDDCKQWHEAPFKTLTEAREFCEALNNYELTFERVATDYAKEKPRNLAAARSCAVWPDATDEQLCAPRADLEKALLARLPGLLVDFRATIEGAGLTYEAPDKV